MVSEVPHGRSSKPRHRGSDRHRKDAGESRIPAPDEKQEPIYWVEFDRNFATREWFGPDQLRLIARPNSTDEPGFYPSRSIMGG
jgi:hypothetical protein